MKKIATVGGILLSGVLVLALAMYVMVNTEEGTKRFETEFIATTLDGVKVKIRAFGDCLESVDLTEEIVKFQEAMREKISQIEHSEMTKKLKLKFREIVNDSEERGLKIDSLSQSDPEEE